MTMIAKAELEMTVQVQVQVESIDPSLPPVDQAICERIAAVRRAIDDLVVSRDLSSRGNRSVAFCHVTHCALGNAEFWPHEPQMGDASKLLDLINKYLNGPNRT